MNRLLALFALAVLAGFLVILCLEVPSPDLIVVVAVAFVLAGFDFIRSAFRSGE